MDGDTNAALVTDALALALWGARREGPWPCRRDLDVLLLDGTEDDAALLTASVACVRGSLLEPLPDATFDVVASLDGLNHVDDVPGALADLLGRVRPGGRLVLATGSSDGTGSAPVPTWHDWAVVGAGARATVLNRSADGEVTVHRDVRVLAGAPGWPERRRLSQSDLRTSLSRFDVTVIHAASDERGNVLVVVPGHRRTAGAALDGVRLAGAALDLASASMRSFSALPVIHLGAKAAVAVPAPEVHGSVGLQVLALSTAVIVADASRHEALPQPIASRAPMVVRYGRSVPPGPSPFGGPAHVVRGCASPDDAAVAPTLSVELPMAPGTPDAAPPSFDVLAIMAAYNEADIVERQLRLLIDQGIRCHVIDNWSSDGTYEIVQGLTSTYAVTVERFPASGATGTYDWAAILDRVEAVAATSGADWVVHHDIDEVRLPPWDADLREALWTVDRCGYDAVDHRVVQHHPTADDGTDDAPLLERLPWCEFERFDGNAHQVKAWKHTGVRPVIAAVGGHDIAFVNRRVFPLRFALHHFPIRSQEHGERKVLRERRARWNPEERARGWHTQYDHLPERPSFVRSTEGLLRWRPGFEARHLVEVAVGLQERAA